MKNEFLPLLKLGLVADSHGDPEILKKAFDVLAIHGAEKIVHLGDFFDSRNCNYIEEILDLLKCRKVLAVKGNNDYQVEKMIEAGSFPISVHKRKQWLTFLQKIPIIIEFDSVCCCHSMPFKSIRAFYDPVDTGSVEQAAGIFEKTGYQVVFCGHSHAPAVFRYQKGKVARSSLAGRTSMEFKSDQRYIVIVGAAENNECAVFDMGNFHYKRIKI